MSLPVGRILVGDALEVLRGLPEDSVHCVVTSPPYWGLRDYGVAGQLGLEPVHDCQGWATGEPCGGCYICRVVAVFREVRRVLRKDGTCWVNMGDSYLGKNLCAVPWRLALALQADGWWLRSDIIWVKPNPMPSSVKDRPVVSHEYVFLLTKSRRYFYDHEAVREASASAQRGEPTPSCCLLPPGAKGVQPGNTAQGRVRRAAQPWPQGWATETKHEAVDHNRRTKRRTVKQGTGEITFPATSRSRRTVWTVATHPFPDAHFATFPPRLVEPCIKAGCPVGGVVLDPFIGAGTVGVVSAGLGRRYVGIELNPAYAAMAEERIRREAGLLAV